jgi:predicted ATPase
MEAAMRKRSVHAFPTRSDAVIKQVHENQPSRLVLRGYKSIAACDIDLRHLNVLIGANGAGKSNFIGFFRLISRILDEQLQNTVGAAGGPDALLHFGRKTTEEMHAELYFGSHHHGYKFDLRPTQDNRLMFSREVLWWNFRGEQQPHTGHFETHFAEPAERDSIQDAVLTAMRGWRVHHFHDTSSSALVKQIHAINDNEYLREDGRNLAAFLYRLEQHHSAHYKRIVKSVQLVSPSFGNFHLRPTVGNAEKIQLEWTEEGQDTPFNASALSDGTLRFICLATVLQQPEEFMPSSILIDEPELGLHPYAIAVLGAMMKSVTRQHQLIISTQSVELVNEFDAEDLVVVDKTGGASTFRRLALDPLADWLADYSLGELWKKNLLGGRPAR